MSTRRVYWLVLDGPEPELCYNDPGRDVDLVVTVDEIAFGRVLMGRARISDAISRGDIELDGRPELIRDFPRWLGPSRFAPYAIPA